MLMNDNGYLGYEEWLAVDEREGSKYNQHMTSEAIAEKEYTRAIKPHQQIMNFSEGEEKQLYKLKSIFEEEKENDLPM